MAPAIVCNLVEVSPVGLACAADTVDDASVSSPHTVAFACSKLEPDDDGGAEALELELVSLEHAASVAASSRMIATAVERR